MGCDREDKHCYCLRHWMHHCWMQNYLIERPYSHNVNCYRKSTMWMQDISCDLCAVNMLLRSKARSLFISDSRLRPISIMEARAVFCLNLFAPLWALTLTDLQLALTDAISLLTHLHRCRIFTPGNHKTSSTHPLECAILLLCRHVSNNSPSHPPSFPFHIHTHTLYTRSLACAHTSGQGVN